MMMMKQGIMKTGSSLQICTKFYGMIMRPAKGMFSLHITDVHPTTLNLICTNDVVQFVMAKADCKAMYRSATRKCSAMWSIVSRSTVASEILGEFSKIKLLVPAAKVELIS